MWTINKHIRGEKLGKPMTIEQMKKNKKYSNSRTNPHMFVSTCIQVLNFFSLTNQTPTTLVYLGSDFFWPKASISEQWTVMFLFKDVLQRLKLASYVSNLFFLSKSFKIKENYTNNVGKNYNMILYISFIVC